MEPKEYTIETVEPAFGGTPDNYGNIPYNVGFKEWEGKAPLWSTKKHLEPGMKVTGVIEEKTSKAGKTYYKFRAGNNENVPTVGQHYQKKKVDWDAKDKRIQAHGALNTAIELFKARGEKPTEEQLIELSKKVMGYVEHLIEQDATPYGKIEDEGTDVTEEELNQIPF